MNKVRYIRNKSYFTGNYTPGGITVVSKLNYDNQYLRYPTSIEFAIACCNSNDPFVKKVGRELATERLNNKDSNFYRKLDLNIERKLFAWEINTLIDINILYTMNISNLAYEILFHKLRVHRLRVYND